MMDEFLLEENEGSAGGVSSPAASVAILLKYV
jgi:hypothetical protein